MTKSGKFFAGIAVGAALMLGAGSASAATFLLKDTAGGATDILNTSGELTGGNAAVKASAVGVNFFDVGYFEITPGELLTSYSITTQGTSKIAEISGGQAGLYKFDGSVYSLLADTVINLQVAPAGVISQLASFSGEFALGPGLYAIGVASTGIDTVRTQGNAKYSVELQGTAVPEPATWGVMLVGFGAIGATMRRRRAAALTA